MRLLTNVDKSWLEAAESLQISKYWESAKVPREANTVVTAWAIPSNRASLVLT